MEASTIKSICEKYAPRQGSIIGILEEIQSKYSYLPEDALRIVSETTGHSLVDIYGVATFYKSFSLKPRGRHLISTCMGTACHVRGAPSVAREIERVLGVKAGETTPDRTFTFETVNCLGACALGPVVVVDGHYFAEVRPSGVKDIIEQTKAGLDRISVETDERVFPVTVSCAHCNHSLMDSHHLIDGHPGIRVTVSFGDQHGWMLLSSLYGSFNVSTEFEIPTDAIVHLFCPHCHAELKGGALCADCGAPMVPMIVAGGGVVQICSRRGCRGHILDLGGSGID